MKCPLFKLNEEVCYFREMAGRLELKTGIIKEIFKQEVHCGEKINFYYLIGDDKSFVLEDFIREIVKKQTKVRYNDCVEIYDSSMYYSLQFKAFTRHLKKCKFYNFNSLGILESIEIYSEKLNNFIRVYESKWYHRQLWKAFYRNLY